MSIEDKIETFVKEVGCRALNDEQKRVYKIFTKTKGRPMRFSIIDQAGNTVSFNIYCDKKDCGTQHILMKHYKSAMGRVTAMEILNLCDIIRNGKRYKSNAYTVYKYKYIKRKVTYKVALRLTAKGLLKSFYSDRT